MLLAHGDLAYPFPREQALQVGGRFTRRNCHVKGIPSIDVPSCRGIGGKVLFQVGDNGLQAENESMRLLAQQGLQQSGVEP